MTENPRIEEHKTETVKKLGIMLDYLGLEATLKAGTKGEKISIIISSEEAGRIIGRKGQTLESLQMLLNRMMFKGDRECPRILLDMDGYSRSNRTPEDGNRDRGGRRDDRRRDDRRDNRRFDDRGDDRRGPRRDAPRSEEDVEALKTQAIDAAKEVKRWGESVTMRPMNSHDRRIVHITLEEDPELITESSGDGNLKKIIISLKK
jgi:spoIIIJ-associated protein